MLTTPPFAPPYRAAFYAVLHSRDVPLPSGIDLQDTSAAGRRRGRRARGPAVLRAGGGEVPARLLPHAARVRRHGLQQLGVDPAQLRHHGGVPAGRDHAVVNAADPRPAPVPRPRRRPPPPGAARRRPRLPAGRRAGRPRHLLPLRAARAAHAGLVRALLQWQQ